MVLRMSRWKDQDLLAVLLGGGRDNHQYLAGHLRALGRAVWDWRRIGVHQEMQTRQLGEGCSRKDQDNQVYWGQARKTSRGDWNLIMMTRTISTQMMSQRL